MKKPFLLHFLCLLVMLLSIVPLMSSAADLDIKLNLMNGGPLTSDEVSAGSSVSFGINSAGTRVAADDASAVVVFNNFKFHDNTHGLTPGTVTIKVPGSAKITVGNCAWGSDVTVKDASDNTACTFSTKAAGNCYDGTDAKTTSGYYSGVATTLTVSGGSYWPYFAVKTESVVQYTTTFTVGTSGAIGVAPAPITAVSSVKVAVPANRSLYLAGSTLTGWTDGTTTYSIGDSILPNSNMSLTPLFRKNTKTLADRTDSLLTIKWYTCSLGGTPTYALQGSSNAYGALVQQVVIGGESIDVACLIDATNGKFNNANWSDWAQVNNGTVITIPTGKGSMFESQGYSAFGASGKTSTTIDGLNDYTSSPTITYSYAGTKDSTMKVIVGNDAGYIRYFQMTYLMPEKTVFSDSISVLWPCNLGNTNPTDGQSSVKGAFSITSNTVGSNLKVVGTGTEKILLYTYTKYQPLTDNAAPHTPGAYVDFAVNPSKGLTFTPTSISFKTTRFGTDGGFWRVYYVTNDSVETLLKDSIKPARNNGTPSYTDMTIKIPVSLASQGEGVVRFYLYALGSTKQVGLSQVCFKGYVSGTLIPIVKYKLTASVSPAAGGSVAKKPNSTVYDAGTEVTLIASRNFGYKFVNWTDSITGSVVSTESTITQTVKGETHLVANFQTVNTYSLTTSVSEGAASYMVVPSPAGTLVDGKIMYEEGDAVQLTATGNPAYTFTGWSDGQTSSVINFTMTSNKSFAANFEPSNYVCGWDFHNTGNSGRVTDFHATTDNETTNLVLRKADGTTIAWLDKSFVKGSYEGAPAAVNWQNISDKWYYQTCINATNYTNLSVQSQMLYNYNAYQIQKLEYSLDDSNWTTLTTVTMPDVKVWTNVNATLPSECNHAAKLYLRWIPDYTSTVVGTASTNDGTSISAIYVMGTDAIFNDGKAPILQTSVPATGSAGASASGKIVLTYDKKVQIAEGTTAILGDKILTPSITGKTITFSYSGLSYNTDYTFTLAGNTVSDLSGNVQSSPVSLNFKTMERTAVTKSLYDFVVDGTDGKTIVDAIKAANAQTSGKRYRIFVKNGQHYLGSVLTAINTANISIIGENEDSTIIYNKPTVEGISVTATIQLGATAQNVYMQDLTLKNAYDYLGTTGRAVALQDKGDKNIFKNVKLLSYQDTYYSNNATMRSYFEDCEIHGVVDFICGSGDIFFNRNRLYLEDRSGNCITAPATSTNWGYVFSNCTIDGAPSNNGSYHLGRNWQGAPRCVYLNTTMNVLPAGEGWTDMSTTALPALFAEYKSVTASGSAVDCSGRKTTYTAGTVTYSPVLSDADAANYTIENVLGGTDQWVPTASTEQETAPEISATVGSSTISWNASDYALLYAVCVDGKVKYFTTDNSYTFAPDEAGMVSVRAANEIGGLGAMSNIVKLNHGIVTGLDSNVSSGHVLRTDYYSIDGIKLNKVQKGLTIQRQILKDGSTVVKSVLKK
jgi:uncharacterized repeat protein (TIGR02543 family)